VVYNWRIQWLVVYTIIFLDFFATCALPFSETGLFTLSTQHSKYVRQ
jgi:hypothetical protein